MTNRRDFVSAMFLQWWLTAVACLLLAFSSAATAEEKAVRNAAPIRIAVNGRPTASIVVASGVSIPYAATELKKYLRLLSGADLQITTDGQIAGRPAREPLILIGDPEANKAVREAMTRKWVSFTGLKRDGFILKSGRLGARPAWLLAAMMTRQPCMRRMN